MGLNKNPVTFDMADSPRDTISNRNKAGAICCVLSFSTQKQQATQQKM